MFIYTILNRIDSMKGRIIVGRRFLKRMENDSSPIIISRQLCTVYFLNKTMYCLRRRLPCASIIGHARTVHDALNLFFLGNIDYTSYINY